MLLEYTNKYKSFTSNNFMKVNLLHDSMQRFLYIGLTLGDIGAALSGRKLEARLFIGLERSSKARDTNKEVGLSCRVRLRDRITVTLSEPTMPLDTNYQVQIERASLEKLRTLPEAEHLLDLEGKTISTRYAGTDVIEVYKMAENSD